MTRTSTGRWAWTLPLLATAVRAGEGNPFSEACPDPARFEQDIAGALVQEQP